MIARIGLASADEALGGGAALAHVDAHADVWARLEETDLFDDGPTQERTRGDRTAARRHAFRVGAAPKLFALVTFYEIAVARRVAAADAFGQEDAVAAGVGAEEAFAALAGREAAFEPVAVLDFDEAIGACGEAFARIAKHRAAAPAEGLAGIASLTGAHLHANIAGGTLAAGIVGRLEAVGAKAAVNEGQRERKRRTRAPRSKKGRPVRYGVGS